MSNSILIVDDEKDIADLLEIYLKAENFIVHKFYDARKASDCIAKQEFDLAILDIMMPEINGLALCQKIREQYTYPVIMLTAKDQEIDKITGLTLGADDYITKPFRPLELIARVKAQLRRYKDFSGRHDTSADGILTHSGLIMNTATYQCTLNEKPLVLTPTEFAILRTLLEHKGNVVSAEALFHSTWKDEYYSKSNNTITVHIRHLREKLHDTVENPKYIRTVWGVGYKIEN